MRFLIAFLLLPFMAFAQADRAVEVQFQRLDSIVANVLQENDEIRIQLRELQRANERLMSENAALSDKVTTLEDDMLTLSNTDLASLATNQQKLFNDVPIFNWGSETRACPNLGEHQQIKMVQNPDKTHTLRYLCFDGRVLHLGTEVHQPPE